MEQKALPYEHPSVWLGQDLKNKTDWIVQLDDADIAQLEAALLQVKPRGIQIPQLSRADFPLPGLQNKLQKILFELESGRGFVLVRGFPVERFSKSDAALVYWGLGAHLGHAYAQNAQGDMLGHVRDLGANTKTQMRARGYQTRQHLPFHNDSTDVVGLMCLSVAKQGGLSRIVSSSAIHNKFLAERPDLWKVMYEPFCVDRRGEESEGQKPYYVTPCFCMHNGKLFVRYNKSYIESAQRFEEVPRLTDLQREAFEFMDRACADPDYHLDMTLEPGDMQFICNYVILHSRTDYEDWPEPERKRHLLRLWLRTPGYADLPPEYADRNADMIAWQRHPKQPVFDVSEIAAALEH